MLWLQAWFNRKWIRCLRIGLINDGDVFQAIEDRNDASRQGTAVPFFAAAHKAVKRYDKGNYGPWTDYEWGLINGKLSAIRWVLGDDWDYLDT